MERLPSDIVADILSRLPVKNLLQIKCVSKLWNTTISSPKFANLQLQQSLLSQENNNNGNNFKLLILPEDFEPLCLNYENEFQIDEFDAYKLDFPLGYEQHIQSLGCCHGMFCLMFGDELVLWNPSIRQYRVLPRSNNDSVYCYRTHGFGYDSVSDDYKVIRASRVSDKVVLEVFALKTNYWRVVEELCPWFIFHQSRNFLNGSLHWLDTRFDLDKTMSAAFSLAKEKFVEIPMPDVDGVRFTEMVVFDGCLCVYSEVDVNRGIDIWVMKEYMIKDSWTKLGTVFTDTIPNFDKYFRPLCYARNGDILLEIDGQGVVKYNMNERRCTSTVFNIKYDNLDPMIYAYIEALAYVESLVSPHFDAVRHQSNDEALKLKKDALKMEIGSELLRITCHWLHRFGQEHWQLRLLISNFQKLRFTIFLFFISIFLLVNLLHLLEYFDVVLDFICIRNL